MSDSHQKQIAVIGGLLNQTDVNAKRVLSSYDPSVSYNSNVKSLKKCNTTQLESCATFLGFSVRNDENEKLYRNQGILVDRIILKIESLFETQCSDCNQSYQNSLDDTPPLTCILCMQGSHNCASIGPKIDAMGQNKPIGVSCCVLGASPKTT